MSKNKYLDCPKPVEIAEKICLEKSPCVTNLNLLLAKPTFKNLTITRIQKERAKPFQSEISRAVSGSNMFRSIEKDQWQQKSLKDFGINSLEDVTFDSRNTIPHLQKHCKEWGWTIDDLEKYEAGAAVIISNFLTLVSHNQVIVPKFNSRYGNAEIELYNIPQKTFVVLGYDSIRQNWNFVSYFKYQTINPYLNHNLYIHVNSFIEHHLDLRTCNLFTNPKTQKQIVKRIERAKYLRQQLEEISPNNYWKELIIKSRGSLNNIR